MGKLKVKDIENRQITRILKVTGNGNLATEDDLIKLINSQEMLIQRQAGQIAAYQSIETNAKYPRNQE